MRAGILVSANSAVCHKRETSKPENLIVIKERQKNLGFGFFFLKKNPCTD